MEERANPTKDKYKDCACLKVVTAYWNGVSRSFLEASQKVIEEMMGTLNEPAQNVPGTFDCDKDNRVNLEYADYLK